MIGDVLLLCVRWNVDIKVMQIKEQKGGLRDGFSYSLQSYISMRLKKKNITPQTKATGKCITISFPYVYSMSWNILNYCATSYLSGNVSYCQTILLKKVASYTTSYFLKVGSYIEITSFTNTYWKYL